MGIGRGRSAFAARQLSWLLGSGTAIGLSDGELLERVVAAAPGGGDAAEMAFQVLIERHGSMVLRVCECALGDRHDAEDAFQATFLTLAKKARTIWVKDSLGPWLYAVALRVTAKSKANIARRTHHERKAAEMAATHQDDGTRPDREQAAVLHEEVGRLPEKYRAPIVLCYLEGLTHEAAAEQLNWPVGTVRGRLARARGLLKSRLARRGLAEPTAFLIAAVATGGAEARAEVPAALARSTAHAAVSLLAGAETQAVASVTVAELVRSVGSALAWRRLRSAVLASVVLFAVGTAIYASRVPLLLPDNTRVLKGHDGSVTSLAFSPDGRTLASGGFDSLVRVWVLGRRSERFRLPGGPGMVTSVAFASDGKTLASAGHNPFITLWDARSGRKFDTIASGQARTTHTAMNDGVNALAFSPDGRILAWALGRNADAKQYVRLWDRAAGRMIPIPPLHHEFVMSVAFSRDGRLLASADWTGTVQLWDLERNRLHRTLKGTKGTFSSLAFSPDGRWLACVGSIPKVAIHVWDVANGAEVSVLEGHNMAIFSVAFSPDGQTLASGDGDGVVKVWEISEGREQATVKAHPTTIAAIAYSPDGKTLATGGWDDTVRLWKVADLVTPPDDPLRRPGE